MQDRRLLQVHAHPDDEAIQTGATMISYVRQGVAIVAKISEFAVENYQLVRGERGPGSGPYGWESDLFAGVDGAP
jgi:hypothetical protein